MRALVLVGLLAGCGNPSGGGVAEPQPPAIACDRITSGLERFTSAAEADAAGRGVGGEYCAAAPAAMARLRSLLSVLEFWAAVDPRPGTCELGQFFGRSQAALAQLSDMHERLCNPLAPQ